ncbi:MAG: glycosyltransferase family 4 protein [Desulfobacterales bacterium]|nr:glycosyltransferase family 4 protein [Desulfobacterales bacterium]
MNRASARCGGSQQDGFDEMINVLFVLPGLGSGGSERVVLDLAKGLDKENFKPFVFSILGGPLEAQFKNAAIGLFISNKQPGKGYLTLMTQIHQVIKECQIDIVLPHHWVSLFYAFFGMILNRRKVRLYYTEHSTFEIVSLQPFYKIIAMIFLNFSAGCIAISREISNAFEKSLKISRRKLYYIPNSVDQGRFEQPVDIRKTRAALGIRPARWVIGTVANFKEVKNHRSLIFAFQQVQEKFKDAVLLLIGAGHLEDEIKSLVNKLGLKENVLFLGYKPDVSLWIRILDIFCLPSFSEGFPICILEAMACKIPIVATDVSGINEIIESGQNGLLVPSNDSKQLAVAMIRLLQDNKLRAELAQQGYDTFKKKYDFKQWIKKYERLFTNRAKSDYFAPQNQL